MATYGTDLVVLATGSDADGSGTWLELASPYASGGTPGQDGENFIQGVDCVSQSLSASKTGAVFSIAFDVGSDISGSFAAGDVVMAWVYFAVGSNLDTLANGGHRFVIGSSTSALDSYFISGNDRSPNPYGGWWNVAVDPTLGSDLADGGGNGGAWRYFGTIVNILATISKGTPHAVDAQRFGRGEIFCTGTGATFTLLAADNDLIGNRWGLFRDTGGGSFLWKGLMSLGQVGTAVTLTASNQNIKVDDAAKTYLAFNKIEIRHVDTSVTWDNIVFSAAGTVSPGQFEMVEDGTFVMNGGGFNNMDTFLFLTGGTMTGVLWNGCNQVTHGGSIFDGCKFEGYEGTADTTYLIYNAAVDPDGELDNCEFTMGTALTHAIEFTSAAPLTMTIRGMVTSGYNAVDGNNDSTFLFADRGSDVTWTLNIIGGTGNFSFKKARAGDTVNIVLSPVTTLINVKDENDANLQNTQVLLEAGDGAGDLPFEDVVTITHVTTTAIVAHTAHGMDSGDKVVIRNANEQPYNGIFPISNVTVNAYDYTMGSDPGTNATGTIDATGVIVAGLTDASGNVSASASFSVDQNARGKIKIATTTPLYKPFPAKGFFTDVVDSVNGLTKSVAMIRDD